jgi:hypothetical protein
MSAFEIQPPYASFFARDGRPLEAGYVWVGVVNQDPQANPVAVYFDPEMTIVAAQPLRTVGGYIVRSGTPTAIYATGDCSIRVIDKDGTVVYNAKAIKPGDASSSAADAAAAQAAAEAAVGASTAAQAAADAALAAAAAAQAAAEAAAEEDLYLGPHADDPTLDNAGDPLRVGAIYYNTGLKVLRTWDGAAWSTVGVSAGAPGDVVTVAGTAAPVGGYLRADGEAYPQSSYPALFGVVGIRPGISTANNWTRSNIGPGSGFTGTVTGCAFGVGLYVLVGSPSNVYTSPSGEQNAWTARTSGLSSSMTGVAFGYQNGDINLPLFVAVAGGGGFTTSPDGINWTAGTIGLPEIPSFTFVKYVNNIFIAGASNSLAYTSPDGITWTLIPIPAGMQSVYSARDAAYGLGSYVIVGLINTTIAGGSVRGVLVSSDAVTWQYRQVPIIGIPNGATSVAFGNGVFVMGTNQGALFSKDLLTWRPALGVLTSAAVAGNASVVFGHGIFVYTDASSTSGHAQGYLARSVDGVTWQESRMANGSPFFTYRLEFTSNGKFVACTGSGGEFLISDLGYDPTTHFAVPYIPVTPVSGVKTYIKT